MQYNDLLAFIEYVDVITKHELYDYVILIIKEYNREHINKPQRDTLIHILRDKTQFIFTVDEFIQHLKKAKLFANSRISGDINDYPVFYLNCLSGYLSIDRDKSTCDNPVFMCKTNAICAIVFKSFKEAREFVHKYNLDNTNRVEIHQGYDEMASDTQLHKYTSKYGDFYYF